MSTVQRDNKAHSAKNRPARIPLGQGSKLAVFDPYAIDTENFHYYGFIDHPGVLESAERAWYEYVKDDQGQNVTTPAGNGRNHYLMRIAIKEYRKDMRNQQKLVTDTTRQKIAVNANAGEYSPEGHKSAITRDI